MKKILLALSLFSGGAFAFFGGEISVGAWNQDPKGYIQYPSDKGTPLDVDKDLKLGSETKFNGKIKIELPSILPNLYFQYINMKFSGTNTVSNIRFGNYVFNASVNTSVKANQFDVGLYYRIPLLKYIPKLEPDWGVVVKIVDFKAEVSGTATEVNTGISGNYKESTSKTVPLPLLYVHLGVYPLDWIGVWGEFKGLKVSDNYFYEWSGAIRGIYPKLRVVKPFIEVGYRYQRLRIKDTGDINADIRIGGVFGNVGFKF